MNESLYQRIGGKAVVDAVVERFYRGVLADERINLFFSVVDMDSQRHKQKIFLAHMFGAPSGWDGRTLRAAHAHMRLDESHFDAVAENLRDALEETGVAQELIDEVLAIAASVRDDVIDR